MKEYKFVGASKPFTHEKAPAAKSIEGYVLMVTNLHPETTEDHIYDAFEEYAPVHRLHLNHDKYTGYVKGYALLEFKELDDTMDILLAHRKDKINILGRALNVDYAFVEQPGKKADEEEEEEGDEGVSKEEKARAEAAMLRRRIGDNSTRDLSPTRD